MRIRLFVLTVSLVLGVWVETPAQTICSGRITGSGGKDLPLAHATLLTPDAASVVQIAQASNDGVYRVTAPHPGFWVLRFTGVGYAAQKIALYVPSRSPVTLDVSLGCYHYLPGEPELTVVGDFNLWNIATAVPLLRDVDGTYSATIPTTKDSIEFRIRGYRDGDGVEGIRDASYVLNGEGAYNARIKASGGTARIVVDPRLLDRTGTATQIAFIAASERTRKIASAVREWWEGDHDYFLAQAQIAMGRKPLDTPVVDWNSLVASLLQQENKEHDSLVASVLALAHVSTGVKSRHKDVASLTKSLERLSPTSAVWSLNAIALSAAVRNTSWSKARREGYLQSAMQKNPERRVRVAVLFSEFAIAFQADANVKAARYYDQLTGEYGDTPEGKLVKKQYPRPEPESDTE